MGHRHHDHLTHRMSREVTPIDGGGRAPATRWPYGGADRTVRASDQDREAAIALLNEHTAAGRLTLAEFEERVGAVYAAQRLSDIDLHLADLPVQRTVARPPAEPEVPTRQMWAPWVLAGSICTLIWAISMIGADRFIYPWPIWVIGPWGIVLLSRTIGRSRR
jgi:hypothetical protein